MCNCTCRIILFTVNLVVGLAAFLVAIAGALLTWGKDVVNEQLTQAIGPFVERIYGQEMAAQVTHISELVLRFTSPFGLPIFIVGLVVLGICFFGFCGACCNQSTCLKVYIGLLTVMLVIEIGLMSFYYSNRPMVFELAQNVLNQTLVEYRSFKAEEASSVLFNVMMPVLNCCGVVSGSDFRSAPNFEKQMEIEGNIVVLEYPYACCKMNSNFEPIFPTCPRTFTAENSNINRGCWKELEPYLVHFSNMASLIGLVVLIIQLFLIIVAIVAVALNRI